MKHSGDLAFIFSRDVLGDILDCDFGKLVLLQNTTQGPREFKILDNSIGTLRNTKRVLMKTKGSLQLFQKNVCTVEESSMRGRFLVSQLLDGEIKVALSDLPPLRCLQEVGFGTTCDHAFSLVDKRQKTRARIRLQTFRSGEGRSISLVQAEGVRGYDKALADLCARLREMDGSSVGETGSFSSVLFPDPCVYNPKPSIDIASDEIAFETANNIIRAYLGTLDRSKVGIVDDLDTEYLHDYRVSLRKIRSVLSLFKDVYSEEQTIALKRTFSSLMEPTGRLRDLDVYLLERDFYFGLLPVSLHEGLSSMFDMFGRERGRELKKLQNWLVSSDFERMERNSQKLLFSKNCPERGSNAELPVFDFASDLIWRRYRKVCRIARSIGDDTGDEEVHELRIQCKKLRYLMELCGQAFPRKEVKKLIGSLKVLQDSLGLFNDYSVQQVALEDFLIKRRASESKRDVAIAKSVGALISALHQRQGAERIRALQDFRQFDSAEVQASFSAVFSRKKTAA